MPLDLRTELTKRLDGAGHIVLLAVGSELRGDDAAGLLVAAELKNLPQLTVLIGGTAPENLTGQIKKLKPSHLIIVDAAELKEATGTVRLVELEEIGGFSFSTHALPLKVMIDFILQDHHCAVLIVAIQPKDTTFGAPVDPAVSRAAAQVAADLTAAISS
ncbi:MAG: hydrogenase maturation peptidase HycI [Candidatus Margulisbacteria bacterium]|jgi:hydrogenase maturation protease HycI|nr:hydrogenase maturation peptidase HycI [Candidatus Margulisiibacteriota bacterium]